jgi:hypothetical protein
MHYTTLVIGAQGEDEVREALAPYMENCCAEPDKRFMEFDDMEDDLRAQYENDMVDRVVMPDGRLLDPCNEEFFVPFQHEDSSKPDMQIYIREVPRDLEVRKLPAKDAYQTFEEFADAHCGERDSTYNRYGFWQNPNAQWDWYLIGGRWSLCFQLKKGRKGLIGRPGVFRRSRPLAGRADQALKRDIDFDAMRSERARDAARTYDAVMTAIEGTPINESWEIVSALYPNDAEEKYSDQPRVKAFKASRVKNGSKMKRPARFLRTNWKQFGPVKRSSDWSGRKKFMPSPKPTDSQRRSGIPVFESSSGKRRK